LQNNKNRYRHIWEKVGFKVKEKVIRKKIRKITRKERNITCQV